MFTQQKLGCEAHQQIDHIFKSLFPKYGMAERTEQIRLAHRMLDAMLNNRVALSDAGTGIGKTYVRLLVMPTRYLLVMKEKIGHLLSPTGKQQLKALTTTVMTFYAERGNMIRYTEQNDHGGTNLCTTVSNLDEQLQCTLWGQPRPFLLTSGTLAVGSDFHRFKMESGLNRHSHPQTNRWISSLSNIQSQRV